MKKLLPLILILGFIIPIQPANAITCKQVANLQEDLRMKGILNGSFGLDTRVNIAFSINVRKTIFKNPSCVSDFEYETTVGMISSIKSACLNLNKSDPKYKKWKIDERDYWAGLYGKNFNYACSLWKSIK